MTQLALFSKQIEIDANGWFLHLTEHSLWYSGPPHADTRSETQADHARRILLLLFGRFYHLFKRKGRSASRGSRFWGQIHPPGQ